MYSAYWGKISIPVSSYHVVWLVVPAYHVINIVMVEKSQSNRYFHGLWSFQGYRKTIITNNYCRCK